MNKVKKQNVATTLGLLYKHSFLLRVQFYDHYFLAFYDHLSMCSKM